MRLLKSHLLLLMVLICFGSTSHLIADEKTQIDELVKETGGYSNVSNDQLQNLIDNNVLVVDIRREEEWKQSGIIPGSKTITFFDSSGRINPEFLPKFTAIVKKDQPVVLICRSGARTKVASQAIAQQLGYKNVINVKTGIMTWINEKRPISKYEK